jgi:hypothetical protein
LMRGCLCWFTGVDRDQPVDFIVPYWMLRVEISACSNALPPGI